MQWEAAAVALAIGLLVGSERERSTHGGEPGVRTFALGALLGCFAAMVGEWTFAVAVAAAALFATASYLRAAASDLGITTEVAFVLTVVLGGLAVDHLALSAAAAVVTAVILLSKQRLHRFIQRTITDVEVTDALKFFVIAFVVLPLIPAVKLGPDGVVDLRRIWTLVVVVTALGWVGYLAVRLLGPGRGLPLAGLAGGFVSGAATTGAMARQARNEEVRGPALAGALLASVATLVQLIIVTAVADRRVALSLLPLAVAGSIALAAQALWFARKKSESEVDLASRPFALKPALILAAVLTGLLIVSRLAGEWFGDAGVLVAIALAGLADAHAGALTAASLSAAGTLAPATAAGAAMAAVGVNTVVKVVMAYAAGGRRVGTIFGLALVVPIVAVVAVMLLWRP